MPRADFLEATEGVEAVVQVPRAGSRPRYWLLCTLLFLCTGFVVFGATPTAALDSWSPAPLYGADVISIVVDPRDPEIVLAGTSAGQVYVSRNGGDVWQDAGAAFPLPGWVIEDLVFDPNLPGRLWAALRGIWSGGLVVFSDDLGLRWQTPGSDLSSTSVYSLALVPGEEGYLYAGTADGVWGSTDGAASWRRLSGAIPELRKVTSLLVDPLRPGSVIAGTWRRAYRSDDAGATWRGVFDGMVLDSEVFTLTANPSRPQELWASTCGWVYRSRNSGERWQRFKNGFEERRTPAFEALPTGRFLAGTTAGVYSSDDDGESWVRRSDAALAIHDIAYHAARTERIFLATEGSGVWRSTDGGATFSRRDQGMTNLRIAALTVDGEELFVAVNHAGPSSGIYRSSDGGRTFIPRPVPLPTVLGLASDEGRSWAATEKGLFRRYGADWVPVAELGTRRVDQVVAAGGRVVARTEEGLWEWRQGQFSLLISRRGSPSSVALLGDGLWLSDVSGLYRLRGATEEAVARPSPEGRLVALADGSLIWGSRVGRCHWSGSGSDFKTSGGRPPSPLPVAADWVCDAEPLIRIVDTGDAGYPALLITQNEARLVRADGEEQLLRLAFPARDIVAAVIDGDRLLLGTSGYGLLSGQLPSMPPVEAVVSPASIAASASVEDN